MLHHQRRVKQTRLSRRYGSVDPDNEGYAVERDEASCAVAAHKVTVAVREVLTAANYSRLSEDAVAQAVGVASKWGVPLHVDFGVFRQLAVYARGDIMGLRGLRRWHRPWQEEMAEVPIYQRVVVLFQLTEDCRTEDNLDPRRLHLRIFKNIPKLDVDMLLPGSRVRISWLDSTRIVIPSLGGIGVTIWKIVRLALVVAALSLYTAAVLLGLVLAALGYIVRSVMNYFQTRNRYMLNLTRSLYYQKLDSNAGVLYRLLEEALQQQQCEAMLAYFAMTTVDGPISRRRLRRRIERILRELLQTEIAFKIDETLDRLSGLGLAVEDAEGNWSAVDTEVALARLNAWWDAQPLDVEG